MKKYKIEMEVVLEDDVPVKCIKDLIRSDFIEDDSVEHIARFDGVSSEEYTPKPKRVYQIGDILFSTKFNTKYILAQVGPSHVCIISLKSGKRLYEAVRVENPLDITEEEMYDIYGVCLDELVKVNEK